MLPRIFSDFFNANADVHDHDTRQRHLFHTPFVHSEQTRRRVRVTGVLTHYLFSSIIEYNCSVGQYKKFLKRHMIFHDIYLD